MEKHSQNPVITWVAGRRITIEIVLTFIVFFCYYLFYSGIFSDQSILLLSMLTIAGFYFIGAFFIIEPGSIVMSIASRVFGIASAICVVGILFTIIEIEGARNQLMIGIISLLPASLVMTVGYYRNQREELLMLVIRGYVIFSIGIYYFESAFN